MSEHKEVVVDASKGYEENIIGFRGIVYFCGGLFLLIVLTFGLVYAFQYWVMEAASVEADKSNENPLALKGDDKLPAEPRLQSAPGFGVDTKEGRVSLELREPQAEYRVLLKEWEELMEKGTKDEQTGTVITLPIDEAKEKLLEGGSLKARSEEDSKDTLDEATSIVSSSSAGRLASEKRKQ